VALAASASRSGASRPIEAGGTVGRASGDAPRLSSVRVSQLLIGPIRLILAATLLGGARVAGAEADVAWLALGTGAVVILIAAALDPRRRFLAPARSPEPIPAGARFEPWHVVALGAAFPSTVGVSVLGVVALFFEPTLGAVLAGVLAGMGLGALASGGMLVWWERQHVVRLYSDAAGRLFERALSR
jgi:hypothetical protein